MDISTASLDLGPLDYLKSAGAFRPLEGHPQALRPAALPDQELLRRVAWEIGERQAADRFTPAGCHVALAMVHATQGFLHWRILHDWVERKAGERAADWDGCRMIVRLYDV